MKFKTHIIEEESFEMLDEYKTLADFVLWLYKSKKIKEVPHECISLLIRHAEWYCGEIK